MYELFMIYEYMRITIQRFEVSNTFLKREIITFITFI